MKIDVHGMVVIDALSYIKKTIELALDNRDCVIEVTHGFNRGSRLQKQILKLSSCDHPAIIRVRSHVLNPGISIIDLKVFFD